MISGLKKNTILLDALGKEWQTEGSEEAETLSQD